MPAFVGVPEITPVRPLSFMPVGKKPGRPPSRFHLRGSTPPRARRVTLYALPTFAALKGRFVIRSLPSTARLTSTVCVRPSESVTISLNAYVPGIVGLPVIAPVVASNASPAGPRSWRAHT